MATAGPPSPTTSTGKSFGSRVPSPSWPVQFVPKHFTAPPDMSTQTWPEMKGDPYRDEEFAVTAITPLDSAGTSVAWAMNLSLPSPRNRPQHLRPPVVVIPQ